MAYWYSFDIDDDTLDELDAVYGGLDEPAYGVLITHEPLYGDVYWTETRLLNREEFNGFAQGLGATLGKIASGIGKGIVGIGKGLGKAAKGVGKAAKSGLSWLTTNPSKGKGKARRQARRDARAAAAAAPPDPYDFLAGGQAAPAAAPAQGGGGLDWLGGITAAAAPVALAAVHTVADPQGLTAAPVMPQPTAAVVPGRGYIEAGPIAPGAPPAVPVSRQTHRAQRKQLKADVAANRATTAATRARLKAHKKSRVSGYGRTSDIGDIVASAMFG